MFLFQKEDKVDKKTFKDQLSLSKRIEKRLKFQEKYSKEKYALIVIEGLSQFVPKGPDFTLMGVELDFTVLMLMEYIRTKIIKVDKNKSFFLKINGKLERTTEKIGELFKKQSDQDGFMYVLVSQESIY